MIDRRMEHSGTGRRGPRLRSPSREPRRWSILRSNGFVQASFAKPRSVDDVSTSSRDGTCGPTTQRPYLSVGLSRAGGGTQELLEAQAALSRARDEAHAASEALHSERASSRDLAGVAEAARADAARANDEVNDRSSTTTKRETASRARRNGVARDEKRIKNGQPRERRGAESCPRRREERNQKRQQTICVREWAREL